MSRIRDLASSFVRNLNNLKGWCSPRRILVMESDDWGSIRVPSKEVFEEFIHRGFSVTHTHYNRLDGLESNEDLSKLFDILDKHKDRTGAPACLTANVILANPDFDRIRKSNFTGYFFEHFYDTLSKYPSRDNVRAMYQEGQSRKLFHPQCHGREHLNVNRWMKELQSGNKDVRYAFDAGTTYSGKDDYNYMEALDLDDGSEMGFLEEVLENGLDLFEETFGYRSRSFIAPCYTWDSALERVLLEGGVEFIQGGMNQYVPKGGFDNYDIKKHFLGQRNEYGQLFLTRNCFFEPSLVEKSDWVDYTMASIRDAFRWNKPAIVCAHRINFIGAIVPANRDRNLRLLDELLLRVTTTWPDIEFMTSDALGDLIKKEQTQ